MAKIKSPSKWKWALAVVAVGLYWLSQGPSDAHIRSRIVRIGSDKGMCSGEQIRAPSGQDYILTAAHCDILQGGDGTYSVRTEDGKELIRKAVAEDLNSDLLLLEGLPGVKGLDIADYSWQGEKIRTFTHGKDFSTYSTEGTLIQTKIIDIPLFQLTSDSDRERCSKASKFQMLENYGWCMLHVIEEASTAFIAPGSSGGAAVNSHGELIGVASAADEAGFFYFVILTDIKSFLKNY